MAYQLPLSAQEMKTALARGLGRALMHVRQFGLERDLEAVFEAALHNQTYDPQCEGSRADWMMQFVSGPAEAELCQRLCRALREVQDRSHDLDQQCELALRLAQRGHQAAREALYETFGQAATWEEPRAAWQVLQLEGEAGYRRLLEICPSQEGREILGDQFRALYGRAAPGTERQQSEANPSRCPRLPAREEVFRLLEDDSVPGYGLTYQGSKAEPALREEVFQWLRQQSRPRRIAKGLRFFRMKRSPHWDDAWLKWADHPSAEVRFTAVGALAEWTDDRVRQLALRCLKRGRWRAGEVGLFRRNYEVGDEQRLLALAGVTEHRFVSELVDVCEAHPHPRMLPLLLAVYENTNCLNCRRRALEQMEELGITPEWVCEETRWDALVEWYPDQDLQAQAGNNEE